MARLVSEAGGRRREHFRSAASLALALTFVLLPGCLKPDDHGETISRRLQVDQAPADGKFEPQTGSETKEVDDCRAGQATMEGTIASFERGSVSVKIQGPAAVLHDATYRANGPYFRQLELPSEPVNMTVAWEAFVGDLEFGIHCYY